PDEGIRQDALRGIRSSLVREARAHRRPQTRRADKAGEARPAAPGPTSLQQRLLAEVGLELASSTPELPRGSIEARLAVHQAWLRRCPSAVPLAWLPAARRPLERLIEGARGPFRRQPAILARVLAFAPFWTRCPSEAPQRARTTPGRARELVDHLFLRYPVPAFLHGAWTAGRLFHEALAWFVCLAGGGSLRRWETEVGGLAGASARSLRPYLDHVPPFMSFLRGRTLAEVWAAGGDRTEFDRLREFSGYRLFDGDGESAVLDYDAWRQTVVWLRRHRETLLPDELPAVLGWIAREHARARLRGQPWVLRKDLTQLREALNADDQRAWPARYPDWSCGPYRIVELCFEKALGDEGAAMRHCVASYADDCLNGHSAILSLRRGPRRLVTLEVEPQAREVYQARGRANRSIHPSERRIILRWAREVLGNPAALKDLLD
ncbi:MAG: PcfJ domain-containing protein, partial [Myxococcota bacterium]